MKTQTLHYFEPCQNIDELKLMYRNLCKLHHPDRGGDTATMQAVNIEYAYIVAHLNTFFVCHDAETQSKDLTLFAEIINKIENLPVNIEVIGAWLWVSGNTYPYRNELKTAGLMFAPVKKVWYYRPSEFKSTNFEPLPMADIRKKYGSTLISNHVCNQLN